MQHLIEIRYIDKSGADQTETLDVADTDDAMAFGLKFDEMSHAELAKALSSLVPEARTVIGLHWVRRNPMLASDNDGKLVDPIDM